jgi:hypothetical protein
MNWRLWRIQFFCTHPPHTHKHPRTTQTAKCSGENTAPTQMLSAKSVKVGLCVAGTVAVGLLVARRVAQSRQAAAEDSCDDESQWPKVVKGKAGAAEGSSRRSSSGSSDSSPPGGVGGGGEAGAATPLEDLTESSPLSALLHSLQLADEDQGRATKACYLALSHTCVGAWVPSCPHALGDAVYPPPYMASVASCTRYGFRV